MAAPIRPVSEPPPGPPTPPRSWRRDGWLALWPALTVTLFLAPVAVGLAGTWAPSFGLLPVLGGTSLTLDPWRSLLATPALPGALRLSLFTGFGATLLSLALTVALLAAWQGQPALTRLQRWLAPVLAVPHAALAIGLVFLLAPSGWLVRLISPWASGWERPPDLLLGAPDPWGLSLILGLVLKEVPFLLLMALAAEAQLRPGPMLAVARSAGYGPAMAWLKLVLPRLYPLIRLPVYAVLAFSLSVVDMALILGPSRPPTLAVLVLSWFQAPDLAVRFQAAAGASLQVLLVAGGVALWWLTERLVARLARPWISDGARGRTGPLARFGGCAVAAVAGWGTVGLVLLVLALLGLWSLASRWRFPDALPQGWSLEIWARLLPGLAAPAWTTASAGLTATGLALVLALGCLEHEHRAGLKPGPRALWLLYIPLLVPQIGFLFGVQVALVVLHLDGHWLALVWSHLLFVLPYVFLVLADPWRRLDLRFPRIGACLGLSPWGIFWRLKLPLMLRPVAVAAAVGFAVSAAQYLPTLFAGGGRLATLTTEAVALSSGPDRRVIAAYAVAQAALPLIAFALALALPAWRFRHRRGMRA